MSRVIDPRLLRDDPDLIRTAIRFDATGLDQTAPATLYLYVFRNRDAFERHRAEIGPCAAAYVGDPETFEQIEQSPYVVASQGPWAPQFEAALLEQYLFAVFNGLLLGSLLVENQQRIAHLQAALQRLDERCEGLRQRQRRARQEQIIEEVEVALSVSGAAPRGVGERQGPAARPVAGNFRPGSAFRSLPLT